MAEKKKEYVEGPAKYGDEFTITAIDIAAYFRDSKKSNKTVPYSVVSYKVKKEIISMHLQQGMSIPAAVTTEAQRKALREVKEKENKEGVTIKAVTTQESKNKEEH